MQPRPGNGVRIREGDSADAARLAEFGAKAFQDAFAAQSEPDHIAAHVEAIYGPRQQAAELADPAVTFLIAEAEREMVGYAKLKIGSPPENPEYDNAIEIGRIYVLSPWIGRGVGAALMRTCLDRAEQGGFTTIWLGVWDVNVRAIRFYGRWGFRAAGQVPLFYGGEMCHDIMMQRPVGG